MGLFWFGAGVGYFLKLSVNNYKSKHAFYRPWEYIGYMFGGGIVMVYYDAYRRVMLERVCDREERAELFKQKKLNMVQSVWLSPPAIDHQSEH